MEPIKVRATQPGFYPTPPKEGYKYPGDEFFIKQEKDFSHTWMVRLSPMPVEAVKAPEPVMKLVEPASAVAEPPRQKRKYVRKAKVGE